MKTVEKYYPVFLVIGVLLNANGLCNEILEPDGALYATIAKHIALSGDWINLYGDGHDWLDKPHFPFWLSAASFKIFGINAVAYKLPAFIFWAFGILFTYRLAAELYDTDIAKVASILYVFSLHSILNNFDVRAEPYLTTLIIAAIYYTYKATGVRKGIYIIAAAFAAACAVMTKGIFVLITVFSGFVIYWLIDKQWKQFVNYRWWLLVFLILLFITPELYSLYAQFDQHPEKVVFGRTGVSGLKFFFWDSQFGRFFNTGPIKGHGDPTFFLHTTLWAFLPWSIMLYLAVYQLIKTRGSVQNSTRRWILYGSAIVTFLLFSLSRFQLPHYIVILFPHFSIITAAYLLGIKKEATLRRLTILQITLLLLSAMAIIALSLFSGFGNNWVTIGVAVLVASFTVFFSRGPQLHKLILASVAIPLLLFVFLLNFFYPRLLVYQAGMMAGKLLYENRINSQAATLLASSYSFEFYAPGIVQYVNSLADIVPFMKHDPTAAFYTNSNILPQLQREGYQYRVLKEFPYFHISMLTAGFLHPRTRDRELDKMVLIMLQRPVK